MIEFACAVCSAGKDDASQLAFLVMTAFMTGLPLLLLGAAFYWVVRRIRAMEAEEQSPGSEQSGEVVVAEAVDRASLQPR